MAKYTIKGIAEETARIIGSLASERMTGRVTLVVDMREGGIGSASVEVSRKLSASVSEE